VEIIENDDGTKYLQVDRFYYSEPDLEELNFVIGSYSSNINQHEQGLVLNIINYVTGAMGAVDVYTIGSWFFEVCEKI
jgi:hypothetical protein